MNAAGDAGPPGALRAAVAAAPAAGRLAVLAAFVQARAARSLLLPDASHVGMQTSWVDLGFDSLRAVDLRGELAHATGLALRSTLLFDQPTPDALCRHLLDLLAGTTPAAAPVAPATRGAEPIAIVGAACRFPGGESLEAFWQLLRGGRDAIVRIPADRFDADAIHDADPAAPGKLYVREAGLVGEHDRFDAALFGISPREAVMLDPQQRLLLETTWHALEHANLPPEALASQRVGVYVGTRASEYFDSQTDRSCTAATAYYPTGNAVSTAAGRLSYTFGFRGPCYALDTACSGSLVAVHVAVRALRAGECDTALAGGVNSIFDPVPMAGLCRARMLAPDGRCKSFDASANGYGRGEGCGIVVLKRLADALAHGDRVLAVVRGTSINQDGRSGGLTVPHGPSQAAVIRDALGDAGLEPDAIDYVEAHGTGTALGDPIEVNALDAVFGGRSRPLPIGSVKTNIGHLEAAAGISGLLKTVLALRERTLPATLHFRTPNPHVDWARSIVRVVTAPTPLPGDGRELFAGVSSFGFSGTNCHVVLSSAPPVPATPTTPATVCAPAGASPAPAPAGPWLLALQARDDGALRALARAHADALADAPVDLAAWCHAAAVGRAELPRRAAFTVATRDAAIAALRALAAGDDGAATAVGHASSPPPPVAFLFPGQGAQRAGMGRELYAEEPEFRSALDAAAARLDGQLPAPLRELMFGDAQQLLDRTDATQPVLCAYELALLATLRAAGVRPDHVLGHSVGDFAAAVAAGVLDGGDALRLCAARGALMVERCEPGGMLAVLAPLERWEHLLAEHPGATVAVRNGDANVVVGGEPDALRALQQRLDALGVAARRLPVSHAFHTARTEPMLEPFAALVRGVRLRAPERAFVDGRRGRVAGAELSTAEFWRGHVREPVDFARGLQVLAQSGCRVWLELGPSAMLAALAKDSAGRGRTVIALQRAGRAGRAGLLAALAELWVLGVPVDVAAANHGRGPARATLPAYPFQRQRFWLERRPRPGTGDGGGGGGDGRHPLCGERRSSSLLAPGQRLHAARVAATSPAWLADHRALGHVLLPAAAMLECALAAELAAGTPLPIAVRGTAFRAPRPLDEHPVTLELLRTAGADGATFSLRSGDGGDGGNAGDGGDAGDGTWTTHAEGRTGPAVGASPAPLDLAALAARCPTAIDPDTLYARCADARLDYGPAFRLVRTLRHGAVEAVATVELDPATAPAPFLLHPALLDACFHAATALLPAGTTPFLPLGVESLAVHRRGVARVHCHLRVRAGTAASRSVDLDLADDLGAIVATVRGLQLVPADPAALRAHGARDLLHHVAWDVAPAPPAGPPPQHVLLVGDAELARALAERLPDGAARVTTAAALPGALAQTRVDTVLLLATATATGAEPLAAQERLLADALALVQTTLRAPRPVRLGLVTHGVQPASPAPAGPCPHAAALLGLWRTLALEHPATKPFAIDLDPAVPAADVAAHAAALLAELRALPSGGGDEPELAVRAGQRRVPRVRRGTPTGELVPPATPFRVRTRAYGAFEHLAAVPLERRAPGAGEVELELRAAALNFKDVLHVRGMLRDFAERAGVHTADRQPLGFEGSGVVTAVGDGVVHLRPGDHAVVLAPDCLASHVTVPAGAAFPVPPGVDAIAAAGTPIVYATVLHALEDLACVRPGETVLVHAAAGGVGQAAIALLRGHGCRVLATASAAKRAFVQGLGVEVVGDTRGGDFTAGVRAATGGRGVDVVLNTLNGDAVPRSLDVLRDGGRFVELGKLGVWTAEQVHAARPDVRFHAFDLGDELARDPARLLRLLERLRAGLADGTLPPPTATCVPLARVRSAFEHLAKGHHVGKVVVVLPEPTATERPGDVRGDRTVVLTGASCGIAPAIADALVAAGARHLALLSRTAPAAAWLEALRARGVQVADVAVDVADRGALAAALQHVRATLPPIGGVVHAAGALADALLPSLDVARALAAARPKVAGACWLDELTAGDPLDFFVVTTSIAGTLGNPGQAAYAAANTFLDAFAAWRRARGRAATALAFGPWGGAGMAARLDERLRARLERHGIATVPAATAAQLLVQHRAAPHDVVIAAVRWRDWLQPFGDHVPAPWRALRSTTASATTSGNASASAAPVAALALARVAAGERRAVLRAAVRTQVATVLGFADAGQLAADRTFRDYGLDSLLAVDAKERLERLLGLTLPATLLFDHPDLDRLVDHLLAAAAPPARNAAPAAHGPGGPNEPDDLDGLATDDLAKALADELRDFRARP